MTTDNIIIPIAQHYVRKQFVFIFIYEVLYEENLIPEKTFQLKFCYACNNCTEKVRTGLSCTAFKQRRLCGSTENLNILKSFIFRTKGKLSTFSI